MNLRQINKAESGQALIIVLLLLFIGSLIIAPFLSYMFTGLGAGQANEERMLEFYAADAGVEYAIWGIMHNQIPADMPYFLTMNDKDVSIDIELVEDVEGFLDDLLNENYSGVHDEWQVTEHMVGGGTYAIGVTYSGSMEKEFITGIGAWIMGTYESTDSSSGDDDITDTFPTDNFTVVPDYKGGTAFMWGWQPPIDRPEFGKKSGVYYRSQTFDFSPEDIPEFYISWTVAGPASIGVVTSGENFGIYKVTSTATDPSGSHTQVIARVCVFGDNANILTWETNLE